MQQAKWHTPGNLETPRPHNPAANVGHGKHGNFRGPPGEIFDKVSGCELYVTSEARPQVRVVRNYCRCQHSLGRAFTSKSQRGNPRRRPTLRLIRRLRTLCDLSSAPQDRGLFNHGIHRTQLPRAAGVKWASFKLLDPISFTSTPIHMAAHGKRRHDCHSLVLSNGPWCDGCIFFSVGFQTGGKLVTKNGSCAAARGG